MSAGPIRAKRIEKNYPISQSDTIAKERYNLCEPGPKKEIPVLALLSDTKRCQRPPSRSGCGVLVARCQFALAVLLLRSHAPYSLCHWTLPSPQVLY